MLDCHHSATALPPLLESHPHCTAERLYFRESPSNCKFANEKKLGKIIQINQKKEINELKKEEVLENT